MAVEQSLTSEPCKIAVQRAALWNWAKLAQNFVGLNKFSTYSEYR
jgi:hypothetical protein